MTWPDKICDIENFSWAIIAFIRNTNIYVCLTLHLLFWLTHETLKVLYLKKEMSLFFLKPKYVDNIFGKSNQMVFEE